MTSPAPLPAGGGRVLRPWQAAALAHYLREPCEDYLVTATPGSGKTALALTVAAHLLALRVITRVVVVAPTDHLRTQWAQAAAGFGLSLDPTLSNAVGPVRPDVDGYVTTYAQVAGKPLLHAARSTTKKTLVILDEVHHAGDGLSWGDAVSDAFEPAARRLCLSGTPFRTRAGERIPFVRYVDGQSEADWSYAYRDALRDAVVRPVVFAAYTGTSRWRNSAGEVVAASLSEPATREVEAGAWRTALDPRGQWVPHVIAAMDERITHLRATGMPDAGGLVLASDQEAARAYAIIVEKITGTAPVVILSDDRQASAKITDFAEGRQRMAVCVRMVSEGVDIPRAACLAWMTSYRTPLFFAQAVGRVVRARRPGESATVFLPAVRPLLALAAELESDRNHVLAPPPPSGSELDPLPRPERSVTGGTRFEALDADAEFAHVLSGGQAVLGHAGLVPVPADGSLPGLLSAEQTAALLSAQDADLRRRARGHDAEPRGGLPPVVQPADADDGAVAWRAAADLRREVNRLVATVAARTGTPHAVVHTRLRAAVPGPASASASAALLARRRDHLLAQLR